MSLWTLALRGLRHHGRSHIGVLLGALLATAILTGALAVGDSVRHSLRQIAIARLGDTSLALHNPGRFFRVALADEVAEYLAGKSYTPPVVPLVMMRGAATGQKASGQETDVRVGKVQVVGVAGEAFWRLGKANAPTFTTKTGDDGAVLNNRLAQSLGLAIGDEVILRVDKPSLLSRDAPLSTIEDATVTLRLPVTAILSDAQFGRFSLDANQTPPHNAFVAMPVLQKAIGMENRANTLLVGAPPASGSAKMTHNDATGALWEKWRFDDAGLELRDLPKQNALELRTARVFLDPPVADGAANALPDARGILTYFVNELRVGDRATPYSTVSALERSDDRSAILPKDLRDDETVINDWLARDINAKVGDKLTIRYWLVGPMRKLVEKTSSFTIRKIVPLASGPARDPDLMPNIPGLSDKKDCRDWEPGVPVDLNKLRDKDQDYWTNYRGTPKAFITLAAGQRIWNNRFGNLTAVRYNAGTATLAATRAKAELCIRQAVSPATLGFFFQPVRDQALAASGASFDFGQLFLGFSFFLIVAALLLTALLFGFGVEQRAEESGTLLAVGVPARRVRGLLLLEGGLIAFVAAGLGVAVAVLYTQLIIGGLSGVWSGAVASASLSFHAEPLTLIGGAVGSFLLALVVIGVVTRRQASAPVRVLLAPIGSESEATGSATDKKRRVGVPAHVGAMIAAVLGVALSAFALVAPHDQAAGFFFGAGALLLTAGLLACRALLRRWERNAVASALSIGGLGTRNTVRRSARSLAAVALFACGAFLVVAVGANRHDSTVDSEKRSSGTGGFALYGESSLPVYQDLNTSEGRDEYALDSAALTKAKIVAMRLREGDEASCLNLNKPQTPRLLGVDPRAIADRKAFTFVQTETAGRGRATGWELLESAGEAGDEAVPVIGDTNTIVYSLGKSVGQTIDYTDDRGKRHKLRVVGVLANSVLQGSLVLSENNFTRLFPTESGYRVFLVDAPPADAQTVSRELTRGGEDVGLSLMGAPQRLADFNIVENTYLSIFAILGGLGLILGSVGLGVIVLRNVWERRGELALLRAVGWQNADLHRLLFGEHALLLVLGLGVGVLSALVAVLPALRSPGADVPYLSLGVTLLAVLASGFAWVWIATTIALRQPLLPALRSE